MPLAGVIGAGMPDPMVLVPILLDPIGVLLPDEEPYEPIPLDDPNEELEESIDGVGTVPASLTFLPHAPKASMAAKAAVVMTAVLIFGLSISFS